MDEVRKPLTSRDICLQSLYFGLVLAKIPSYVSYQWYQVWLLEIQENGFIVFWNTVMVSAKHHSMTSWSLLSKKLDFLKEVYLAKVTTIRFFKTYLCSWVKEASRRHLLREQGASETFSAQTWTCPWKENSDHRLWSQMEPYRIPAPSLTSSVTYLI